MNGWLVLYYVVAIALIFLVMGAIRFLGRPRFRDDNGDITTEVGFEEDAVGHVKRDFRSPTQNEIEEPHMAQEKFMQ